MRLKNRLWFPTLAIILLIINIVCVALYSLWTYQYVMTGKPFYAVLFVIFVLLFCHLSNQRIKDIKRYFLLKKIAKQADFKKFLKNYPEKEEEIRKYFDDESIKK